MPGGSHDISTPPGIVLVLWNSTLYLVSEVVHHCKFFISNIHTYKQIICWSAHLGTIEGRVYCAKDI